MQTENSEWEEITQMLYSLSLSALLNEAEMPGKILYLHEGRTEVFCIVEGLTFKHWPAFSTSEENL